MTLKTRRILFYALIALFIVSGTSVIFYSSGWRLDFETLTISRLGALFFEIQPDHATISIEKTPYQFNPGLLKSGLLIANLFPKTYTVKVVKEGYQPWTKELRVRPSLVTEVSPILLIPEKIDLGAAVETDISDFWVGPKHLIVKKENGELYLNKEKIVGNQIVQWSKDGNEAITALNSQYFYINLQKPNSALNVSLIFDSLRDGSDQSPIQRIYFDSFNENNLMLITYRQWYRLNLKKQTLATIYEKAPEAVAVNGNEFIFSDQNSVIAYNPSLNAITRLFTVDAGIQELSASNDFITVLDKNKNLWLFNRRTSVSEEKISDRVQIAPLFSPDKTNIAFINEDKEVVVYDLFSKEKSGGQKTFRMNIGIIEKNSIRWHANSGYLFIKYPNSLYLLEASNIPPINFQVIDLENQKYEYKPDSTLYLLKNSDLYEIDLRQ